ncbi:MAG: hypothetical protein ABI232_09430 [Jatrophihabitantaceae bacterium]
MADLSIDGDTLRIGLSVSERVLGLHGRNIEIPLADIVDVAVVADVMAELDGLRMPGTGIPGFLAIGTWRGHEGDGVFHDFALIHRAGPGVVIVARNATYRRVLVSADDPADLAASLRR